MIGEELRQRSGWAVKNRLKSIRGRAVGGDWEPIGETNNNLRIGYIEFGSGRVGRVDIDFLSRMGLAHCGDGGPEPPEGFLALARPCGALIGSDALTARGVRGRVAVPARR